MQKHGARASFRPLAGLHQGRPRGHRQWHRCDLRGTAQRQPVSSGFWKSRIYRNRTPFEPRFVVVPDARFGNVEKWGFTGENSHSHVCRNGTREPLQNACGFCFFDVSGKGNLDFALVWPCFWRAISAPRKSEFPRGKTPVSVMPIPRPENRAILG